MLKKFFQKIASHKIISFFVIILIIFGGYYAYKKSTATKPVTRYVLANVEKGTLISSVSGSGQISVSNQVDVKAKTSGDVVAVYVKAGQEVKNGALLAQVDASDALKSVRDAETSLETAKLELEQILEPTDELTLLQSENSLIQTKETKQNAIDSLAKSYEDGFNAVSNAFLDLPVVMTGLSDILFSYGFNASQINIDYYAGVIKTYDDMSSIIYHDDAYNKYQIAKIAYDKNFSDYKTASRFSDTEVIENLILESYETTKNIAEAIKSANNLIRLYQDKLTERGLKSQTLSDTHLTNLSSYTSKTNSYLTSLLSAKSAIETNIKSIASAERSIKEKELSIADLKEGSDDLTIRAKKIVIQQKQDALTSARVQLADCSSRTPFDGIVAEISVKKGDSVSSGSAVATIITKQRIAEISLNEVDATKVKVGQKVTLSFDAVSDLTLTGLVAEMDTLGTVSQGVVSYNVKISFDTQDERVKPGMSVSANIITDMKQDALLVPNSAIKSSGDTSYVEMPDEQVDASSVGINSGVVLINSPREQIITTGLANDSYTEVVSGLSENDQIITRTISASSSSSSNSSSANSLFNMGGGGRPEGAQMPRN